MNTQELQKLAGEQLGDAHGAFRGILWAVLLSLGLWGVIAALAAWVAH